MPIQTTTTQSDRFRANAADAIEQLQRSERGRRVLRALADASDDLVMLDSLNRDAALQLVSLFHIGAINGSLLDLLRPHRSPRS